MSRIMRGLIGGYCLLVVCAVQAETVVGVWQGLLGSDPIRVCFEADQTGNYYREQAPLLSQLILGEQADAAGAAVAVDLWWREQNEGQPDQFWLLEEVQQASITGQVVELATQAARPLQLRRLPVESEGSYCATNAYLGPLEADDLVVTKGEWQAFAPQQDAQQSFQPNSQQNYRNIEFGDWQSIELAGKSRAIAKINAAYALATDRQAHQR